MCFFIWFFLTRRTSHLRLPNSQGKMCGKGVFLLRGNGGIMDGYGYECMNADGSDDGSR